MSDTVSDVVALMRCDAVVARLFRGEGLSSNPGIIPRPTLRIPSRQEMRATKSAGARQSHSLKASDSSPLLVTYRLRRTLPVERQDLHLPSHRD